MALAASEGRAWRRLRSPGSVQTAESASRCAPPPTSSPPGARLRSVILLALVVVLAAGTARGQEKSIAWLTDLPEGLAQAARTRKPIVVAFSAAWCPSCRRFMSDTLPAPQVQDLADDFVWVSVDIDRELSIARAHAVEATPRFDLVDPDGVTRLKITGVLSPEEFRRRLKEFLASLQGPRDGVAAVVSAIPADDRTPLTWSPDGYRGLSICFSNVGYGPLHVTSQSPFQSLRFGFQPRTPSTLAEGNFEVRWSETWVNTLNPFHVTPQSQGYLIHTEMLTSDFAAAYGVTDTIELELEVVDRSRFGGYMDRFIEGFHSTFGISNDGRRLVRRDHFLFHIDAQNGRPPVDLKGTGSFQRDLELTLQHNLTCGTEYVPAIAYAVTVGTDLGKPADLRGGSPVDLAFSLSAAKRFGDFYTYASAGFAWFGNEDFHGIDLRATQLSLLLALEWRMFSSFSLVAQILASEGVAKNLSPFSKPSYEITAGFKWEVVRNVVAEVAIIERIINFDNTVDFGPHAGLTVRF